MDVELDLVQSECAGASRWTGRTHPLVRVALALGHLRQGRRDVALVHRRARVRVLPVENTARASDRVSLPYRTGTQRSNARQLTGAPTKAAAASLGTASSWTPPRARGRSARPISDQRERRVSSCPLSSVSPFRRFGLLLAALLGFGRRFWIWGAVGGSERVRNGFLTGRNQLLVQKQHFESLDSKMNCKAIQFFFQFAFHPFPPPFRYKTPDNSQPKAKRPRATRGALM